MRLAISILSLVIIVFLQASFLPSLEVFSVIPNLIFIITIAWCIAGNYKEAIFWAALGGILLDLFSPFYFGIIALSNLSSLIIIYLIIKNFLNNDDKISVAAIGVISTVLYNFFLVLFILIAKLTKLSDITLLLNWEFILILIFKIFLNSIILILIYDFIKSIHEFQAYHEQRRLIKT